MSEKKSLMEMFHEYESSKETHRFYARKHKWFIECPYNVDEERASALSDTKQWRDYAERKRLDLVDAIKAQEKELSVLKRQVEEFKPAFILQQIRAGNVTEVENVDD